MASKLLPTRQDRTRLHAPRPGVLPTPAAAWTIPSWLVWLVAAGFVLTGLGNHALLDNNEGLYAEVAREMLVATDWQHWVIPHLNGLPYMEKPPLLYWLVALAFSVVGLDAFAARLVPALSALGCVGLLLWFGKTQGRALAGRMAALMFVSGIGVAVMARVLMVDMLLAFMLTGALMCAYRFSESGRPVDLRRALGLLGLAVLAKGMVALALFGLVIGTVLAGRHRSPGKMAAALSAWCDPVAWLIFIGVTLPWHVAACIAEPAFAWYYFINEHILRFVGRRVPHDYYGGSWWYYLPRMVIYLFPWSFLLPCLTPRRPDRSHRPPRAGGLGKAAGVFGPAVTPAARLERFLWLSWLAPLLFFSLSSAKANYYLVVVMPLAAFHLATALERRDFLRGQWHAAVPGVLAAALALPLWRVVAVKAQPGQIPASIMGMSDHRFLLALFPAMAAVALLAALIAWRWRRVGLLAYLLLPACIVGVMSIVMQAVEPLVSGRQVAALLQNELSGRVVYLYRDFEEQSALPFYLQTPVAVIDSRSSDLFWGNRLEANPWLIDGAVFAGRLATQPVAVVVRDRQLPDFRACPYFGRFKGSRRIGHTTVFFN